MNEELKTEILTFALNQFSLIDDFSDYWLAFNENLDLNFYLTEDDMLKVIAYDVIDNKTSTDTWVEILECDFNNIDNKSKFLNLFDMTTDNDRYRNVEKFIEQQTKDDLTYFLDNSFDDILEHYDYFMDNL